MPLKERDVLLFAPMRRQAFFLFRFEGWLACHCRAQSHYRKDSRAKTSTSKSSMKAACLLAVLCGMFGVVATGSSLTTATRVYGQMDDFATETSGTSESTLRNPEGLAFDSLGNLYVNDFNNNRIVVYAPGNNSASFRVYGQQGSFTTATTSVESVPLGLSLQRGIAIDSADNLYIADTGNNRVVFVPNGGSDATSTYTRSSPTGLSFSQPYGVCIDRNDNLFVVDSFNNRVLLFINGNTTTAAAVFGQEFDTTNTLILPPSASSFGSAVGAGVSNCAVDQTNHLWIADATNFRALRYDPCLPPLYLCNTVANLVVGQPNFTANSFAGTSPTTMFPLSLYFDSSNNMYVVEGNYSGTFNRVSFWPAPYTRATFVFGQPDMLSNVANNGGRSASSLSFPMYIFLLFVWIRSHLFFTVASCP